MQPTEHEQSKKEEGLSWVWAGKGSDTGLCQSSTAQGQSGSAQGQISIEEGQNSNAQSQSLYQPDPFLLLTYD